VEAIEAEIKRRAVKDKIKTKGKSSGAKKRPSKAPASAELETQLNMPVFPQFSREVEYIYFLVQNRRTKQVNILGAEYQDCFGNAKVEYFFAPETRADQNLARVGLEIAIERLAEIGAVSIFSMGRVDDFETNALYASASFRNTGWLARHTLSDKGTMDLVLWTRKLI
jgi:hypothetical protein